MNLSGRFNHNLQGRMTEIEPENLRRGSTLKAIDRIVKDVMVTATCTYVEKD
jgi:hypothetical protein